jgi:hypothetical protein
MKHSVVRGEETEQRRKVVFHMRNILRNVIK